MTIGVPIVTCLPRLYQPCTNSVPIVKNSQKTVKTAKRTIDVPIVTGPPRLYQICTNRQKQSNSKNDHWCTNRHMSTQSPPNTQSPRPRPPSASAEYTKPRRCEHYHAGAASAALAACPSTSRVRGCMPVTSVAGWSGTRLHSRHPPRSLRTVIAVNYVQSPPGHASLHGRTTTSAIEASMLQAPVCGSVYRRTCDET